MQLGLTKPIVRTSLADAVYQHLLESILSGAVSGGSVLNEVVLAAQFAVSRTPVHEAIRKLAADGLVELLPNRRAQVANFTRGNVVALYELRKILEGSAAAFAASRMHPALLDQFRKRTEELLEAPRAEDEAWRNRAIELDLQLHEAIANSAGNPYLKQEVQRYRRLVQGYCRASGTRENLCAAMEEHLRILAALDSRDAEAARERMVQHIEARLAKVLGIIDLPQPLGQTKGKAL